MLRFGDAVDLNVERPRPRRNADENARRRGGREVSCVNSIHRLEVSWIGTVHIALDDFVERGAGCDQAELHLVEHNLHLPFYGKVKDLARFWINRWKATHKDKTAAAHSG